MKIVCATRSVDETSYLADSKNRIPELFTPYEMDMAHKKKAGAVYALMARYAAKKSIRTLCEQTGLGPVRYLDIEIRRMSTGQPEVIFLSKIVRQQFNQLFKGCLISLTHANGLAIAMVVFL